MLPKIQGESGNSLFPYKKYLAENFEAGMADALL
jgi:hypothetical protein